MDSSSVASDMSLTRCKYIGVCVVSLDDTVHQFQIGRRTLGNTLYTQVIHRFRIVEPEYFDLEFICAPGKQVRSLHITLHFTSSTVCVCLSNLESNSDHQCLQIGTSKYHYGLDFC